MKRFSFPLEKVRQYRKMQLDSEQAKLEDLYTRLRSLEHMEAELERQRRLTENELLAPGAGITGAELEQFRDFRAYTARVAVLIDQRRKATQREVEAQRARLVEARQKYEMLDRLKDRRKDEWELGFQREQEALSSELYLAKWGRA